MAKLSFPFPRHANPTPFEIFHLPTSSTLTNAQVKERYLDLAKAYHPDAPTSSNDSGEKFKAIQEAYSVLRDPTKRARAAAWRGGGPGSMGQEYSFRRGRPMRASYPAKYPSAAWDWGPDPFSAHPQKGGRATGWSAQGTYSSNGSVFLFLLGVTAIATPLTVYAVAPVDPFIARHAGARPLGEGGKKDRWEFDRQSEAQAWGNGGRHELAARALETARREARMDGVKKREAIKQRVRLIENERAAKRAREVLEVESGAKGTGH